MTQSEQEKSPDRSDGRHKKQSKSETLSQTSDGSGDNGDKTQSRLLGGTLVQKREGVEKAVEWDEKVLERAPDTHLVSSGISTRGSPGAFQGKV